MRLKHIVFYIFSSYILISLSSCIKEVFVPLPQLAEENLKNTTAIEKKYQQVFEGVYALKEGSSRIGDSLVCKWAGGKMSFFSRKSGIYVNLDVGYNKSDSTFRFSGYWRSPMLNQQGDIYFSLLNTEGGKNILSLKAQNIILRGEVGNAAIPNGKEPIVIEFVREFSSSVKNRPLEILAHRGGGRNSDNLPYAENSLELIKHAELFGATGIEIDVQLSSDNIPIIYHDADINTRLTRKSPFIGNISSYSYNFLSNSIKLVDGQPIPKLEDALNIAIDSTEIKSIWLDLKSGVKIFDKVVPIVQKAITKTQLKKRNLSIYFGVPSDEIYNEIISYPNYKNLTSLCEISLDKALSINSQVFAPRWTLGILNAETQIAHSKGMKVITWTLDVADIMQTFIKQSQYDGILTNYPSLLAYYYYSHN